MLPLCGRGSAIVVKLFPSGYSLDYLQHLASLSASSFPVIELCPGAHLLAVLKKAVCHARALPSTGC